MEQPQENEQKQAAFRKAWGKIVARAWTDEVFKQRLLKNPQAVLRENGVEIPAGTTYKVIEDTKEVHHLVLHEKPTEVISENQLKRIAGGLCDCADEIEGKKK